MRGEESVCKVYGSYLNYIEFDNVRYWDIRENWEINVFIIRNKNYRKYILRINFLVLHFIEKIEFY